MKDSTLDFFKALVQPVVDTATASGQVLGIQIIAIDPDDLEPLGKKWAHLSGLGIPDLLQALTTRDDDGNIALRVSSADYEPATSTKNITMMESTEALLSNCIAQDGDENPVLVLSIGTTPV